MKICASQATALASREFASRVRPARRARHLQKCSPLVWGSTCKKSQDLHYFESSFDENFFNEKFFKDVSQT